MRENPLLHEIRKIPSTEESGLTTARQLLVLIRNELNRVLREETSSTGFRAGLIDDAVEHVYEAQIALENIPEVVP